MKLSTKQQLELLAELGLDVEPAEDDNPEFDKDAVFTLVKQYLTPDIKAEIGSGLESSLHGTWISSLRSQLARSLSIPTKDLKDKNIQELMEIVKNSKNNSQEANDWKEKYEQTVADYEAQLDKINSDWETKHNTEISAANKKYIDRDINDAFVKITERIPRKGGDLIEQADTLRYKVEKAGYEIKYTADGIELWKDNKKAKVDDVINPIAANIFPVAKDTSHVNPADVKAGRRPAAVGVEQVEQPSDFAAMSKMGKFSEWVNNSEG